MRIMSTNFAKELVWKHEYDVKLWRHKDTTPGTNDHHMPLNETPMKIFFLRHWLGDWPVFLQQLDWPLNWQWSLWSRDPPTNRHRNQLRTLHWFGSYTGSYQNRRQKVFNKGALRLCRGAWYWKFDKIFTDL